MRLQGRITHWDDARGFGRVSWHGGGTPLFIHIRAFVPGTHRPKVGDIVTYELGKDERGRPRAVRADYPRKPVAGAPTTGRPSRAGAVLSILAALVCLLGIAAAVVLGRMPAIALPWYGLASALCFVMYWQDKKAARASRHRTPEQSLHLLALAGGWPGAAVAQQMLRHKSVKGSFRNVFWATVILNVAGLLRFGRDLFGALTLAGG